MALDWKKDISFSGLKRAKSKGSTEFPSKTYMNLAVQPKSKMDVKRSIPLAIVLVIVVGLFVKFGVLDFYGRVNEAQAELNQHQAVLNQLNAQLVNYDAVQEEYEAYDKEHLVSDAGLVSPVETLEMLDRVVAPNAHVQSIAINGNTVTLNVSDITLDSAGALVSLLYKEPIVANVTVSTASTQGVNLVYTENPADGASTADVSTTMIITLQRADEE